MASVVIPNADLKLFNIIKYFSLLETSCLREGTWSLSIDKSYVLANKIIVRIDVTNIVKLKNERENQSVKIIKSTKSNEIGFGL
jgi:hypothetical protein